MMDCVEIETLLIRLLTASTSALSDSERTEVQKFIDVGVYGLALETAVDIYTEEEKIATAEVAHLIERLAIVMDMDPRPLIEKLSR